LEDSEMSFTTNVASRLLSLSKEYGTHILVGAETVNRIKDVERYSIRSMKSVKIKGKNELIKVFEIFDADPEMQRTAKSETLIDFNEAVDLYEKQLYKEAKAKFKEILLEYPHDNLALRLFNKCLDGEMG
jgi:two-component system sensor histidine kinase ChiS